MPLPEPAGLLQAITELAQRAGDKIMEIYDGDIAVANKADDSPLTAADLAAHQCIVAGLAQLADIPVLSEESAALPYAERQTWDSYWLVDPLDGTKEFIKRNGEFTVNIALIRNHKPVLGVVYAPAKSTCYYAAETVGAFKQESGQAPTAIHVRNAVADPIQVAGSRSHGSPELDSYLGNMPAHALQSIGSSLKFCLVAEGLVDIYPRLGPTSEWDTAAAQCVVEQAGGRVTDLAGADLRYNTKESILNPHFLVFGAQPHDWLSYLR